MTRLMAPAAAPVNSNEDTAMPLSKGMVSAAVTPTLNKEADTAAVVNKLKHQHEVDAVVECLRLRGSRAVTSSRSQDADVAQVEACVDMTVEEAEALLKEALAYVGYRATLV